MEELEDSSLDLIYRRRVRSHQPGYVVLVLVILALSSLPLIQVDVVTSARGMVRPLEEPSELFSSLSGMVDSSILRNNLLVESGDTLVWLRRDQPEAKLTAAQARIELLQASAADIQMILSGKHPQFTAPYRQSHRNHLSEKSRLGIRREFLEGEFTTARSLFSHEVISRYEFEKARSAYREICARESDLCEAYKSLLEDDLFRIQSKIKEIRDEIQLILSSLDPYYLVATATGILYDCRSLSAGSVLQAGMSIASISPSGLLAAECYIHPGHRASVEQGTVVKLRLDDLGFCAHQPLKARVDMLDQEISIYQGLPAYRIRCILHDPTIRYTNGKLDSLKNGMTFTASFILFRHSLAALLLEKASLWAHPSQTPALDAKGS